MTATASTGGCTLGRPLPHGAGFFERRVDHRRQQLEMRPSRDLGDDAAVLCMKVDLARDDRRQHLATVAHDCCGRLVTRRLDPECELACAELTR